MGNDGMAELEANVREAVLALEGTVIEDFQLPLPGDLKDLAKAAALVTASQPWRAGLPEPG